MVQNTATQNIVQDVYRALLRHKRKSALLFIAIMTAVVLFTFLSPKEYRSEAKLFVRLGRENATLDPTATLADKTIVAIPQSRESEINSVVELLQSRSLLEKVVDQVGPAVVLNRRDEAATEVSDSAEPAKTGEPVRETGATFAAAYGAGSLLKKGTGSESFSESAAVDGGREVPVPFLQRAAGQQIAQSFDSSADLDLREVAVLDLVKNLKVEAAKKSNVIEVSVLGPDPRLCQTVTAKLIDAYLTEHVRLNRTAGSHEFFAAQTARLRDDLAKKEAELRDLKTKTGLSSPSDQKQIMVARIGRLDDELLHVEAAQAASETKVRQLRQQLESLPETQVTNETSGFNNEGTDKMRDQFYALQIREKEAQARFTEDHPKMQQIREQLASARAILEQEERGRKQVTKEPGRLHHQAELAALAEEPVLASLRVQADRLREQLAEVRRDLGSLNESEMRVAALQREVDMLEADYRKYSANLEQARIDQQLETQRMSNISVAQPASFEPRAVRPRKSLNLLLGLCAALCGAVGLPLVLEQIERPASKPRGAARVADAPVLTKVPRLVPR